MLHEELTLEEKVDYIYDQLKKEQRKKWYRLYLKISFFFLVVILPYYLFINYLPLILSWWMNAVFSSKMPSMWTTQTWANSSVGDIIKGYTKNMTPEQKDAIKKSLESVLGWEDVSAKKVTY